MGVGDCRDGDGDTFSETLHPIVNNWPASLLQPAEPRVAPPGTRQVAPFWLLGASGWADFPAVKANSWESVSCPSANAI